MNYQEALQYLESFINYEKFIDYPYRKSLKLERVKGFLREIGNPQDYFKSIHVAGSKGKGSTCAFIAYILKEAGFKVGLYTSPHLSDFRERIRILDRRHKVRSIKLDPFEGMIPRRRLTSLVSRLKIHIARYNKFSKHGRLSFFEICTSLAFTYFKEEKIDFAVLETGLGGRLDATNVVNSLVSVITPVSYEHTQKLGSTLQKIAWEKSGIIKRNIVISSLQTKAAARVIRTQARKKHASIFEVQKDIRFHEYCGFFQINGIFSRYNSLKTNLLGRHQLINASTAVGAIEALRFYKLFIPSKAIREGIKKTIWPGRCEIVSMRPLVVLDGAQNVASAKALTEVIKKEFKFNKLILVLGISQDKDIPGICRELHRISDMVITTQADNPRAAKSQILAGYFIDRYPYLTKSVPEAMRLARRIANPGDLILVTGSLFVVGQARF